MVIRMMKKHLRYLGFISAILSITYILIGVIEIANTFVSFIPLLILPGDLMGGFVSITIGLIFAYGIKELYRGDYMGLSFILVGLIMAIMFAGLYTLILIADAVECYILGNEDFAGWTILDDLRIELVLGWILLPLLLWLKAQLSSNAE